MFSLSFDAPKYALPNGRRFCPCTPQSGERILHLYYPLNELQRMIESRTFYLGKNRRAEDGTAPHLLDLIGMSRDEADVLYQFAQAAMADVYEQLNQRTLNLPKLYKWENAKKDPVTVRNNQSHSGSSGEYLSYQTTTDGAITPTITSDNKRINITGTVIINTQDYTEAAKIIPHFHYQVTYLKAFTIYGTKSEITTNVVKEVVIDPRFVKYLSADTTVKTVTYMVLPHDIVVDLAPASGVTSAEYIKSVDTSNSDIQVPATDDDTFDFLEPTHLPAGTRFTYLDGRVYEAVVDTDENRLDVLADATPVDDAVFFEEGIHYYIGFPAYINEHSVSPLDNAVAEALVNRIIWKWLLIAYPADAQTYDMLYQQAIQSLRNHCNIFNKNWVNRIPRMM